MSCKQHLLKKNGLLQQLLCSASFLQHNKLGLALVADGHAGASHCVEERGGGVGDKNREGGGAAAGRSYGEGGRGGREGDTRLSDTGGAGMDGDRPNWTVLQLLHVL